MAYTQIGIRLPGELIDQVDDLAFENKTTRSDVIRDVLITYFEFLAERKEAEKSVLDMTDDEIMKLLESMTSVM